MKRRHFRILSVLLGCFGVLFGHASAETAAPLPQDHGAALASLNCKADTLIRTVQSYYEPATPSAAGATTTAATPSEALSRFATTVQFPVGPDQFEVVASDENRAQLVRNGPGGDADREASALASRYGDGWVVDNYVACVE